MPVEVRYLLEESILVSVKKMLGIDPEYDPFDTDITILINSALATLTQIGIGPADGFYITGSDETWSDFLGDSERRLQSVKTYVYIKVKLIFDPPGSSFVMSALEEQAKELEWRLNVRAEEVT